MFGYWDMDSSQNQWPHPAAHVAVQVKVLHVLTFSYGILANKLIRYQNNLYYPTTMHLIKT